MFHPELSGRAQRQLEALHQGPAWAIWEFIHGPLAEDPRRVGAPLRNERAGQMKAVVGRDYRVIYRITGDVVYVLQIGHRNHIYRR